MDESSTANVAFLDFAVVLNSINRMFLLAKSHHVAWVQTSSDAAKITWQE